MTTDNTIERVACLAMDAAVLPQRIEATWSAHVAVVGAVAGAVAGGHSAVSGGAPARRRFVEHAELQLMTPEKAAEENLRSLSCSLSWANGARLRAAINLCEEAFLRPPSTAPMLPARSSAVAGAPQSEPTSRLQGGAALSGGAVSSAHPSTRWCKVPAPFSTASAVLSAPASSSSASLAQPSKRAVPGAPAAPASAAKPGAPNTAPSAVESAEVARDGADAALRAAIERCVGRTEPKAPAELTKPGGAPPTKPAGALGTAPGATKPAGALGTAPPLSALEALEALRTTIDEFGTGWPLMTSLIH